MGKKVFIVFATFILIFFMLSNNEVIATELLDYGDWKYTFDSNSQDILIVEYGGNETSVQIPSSINGKIVKRFDLWAFANNHNVKKINIPDTIEKITPSPSAWALEEYSVSLDNKYYKSIDGVLYNKDETILISYPNVTTHSSITIPSNVVKISECAFYGNNLIESIVLQDKVVSIGLQAFSNCINLKEVTIPSSVEIIGSNILSDSKKALVKCYENSEAEYYAKWHGINYNNSLGILTKRNEIYFDISCSGYHHAMPSKVMIKNALGEYGIFHDGISFTTCRKVPGTTVEIMVQPKEGYKLTENSLCYWQSKANWYVNEARYPIDGTKFTINAVNKELGLYEFVMPDYDIILEAEFELINNKSNNSSRDTNKDDEAIYKNQTQENIRFSIELSDEGNMVLKTYGKGFKNSIVISKDMINIIQNILKAVVIQFKIFCLN